MPVYCYCNHFVANVDIENIFTRPRYQEVTRPSLYRQHKTRQTGKGFKIRPIIDHVNESFQAVFSNGPEKIIDKHMTKFKRSSSMRQYLKMKPQKCGFKWCFWCCSSTGYLYEFDLYFSWKKDIEVNFREEKCGNAIVWKNERDLLHLVFSQQPSIVR